MCFGVIYHVNILRNKSDFRNRYDNRLRELLFCGLPDDPISCGGEEETAFFVYIYITGDVVIVIAGRVMNFAPVVIVVSAVFIYDLGFRLFCTAKFDNVNVFVSGKINCPLEHRPDGRRIFYASMKVEVC